MIKRVLTTEKSLPKIPPKAQEEITNQISQLDHDLDTIEELVREIELSLADFEPLSGFEISDEEKAA